MKKFNYILLSLLLILLTGCSTKETLSTSSISTTIAEANESLTTEETQMTETEEVKSKYPEYVEEIYSRFSDCIAENFPQFELGDITTNNMEKSKFYRIPLNQDSKNFTDIKFHDFEDYLGQNFYIPFSNSSDNMNIKEVIICSILVIDTSLTLEEATLTTTELINSFDGTKNSFVFTINDYLVYLQPVPVLDSIYFQAVSINEINKKVDTSLYQNYELEAYKAPLNEGALAYIKGTIVENVENDDGSHYLIIQNDDGTYIIYYSFTYFADFFEVGQTYTFYGRISKYTEPYIGRLLLDYCE